MGILASEILCAHTYDKIVRCSFGMRRYMAYNEDSCQAKNRRKEERKMFGKCLENVRKSTPLVHNITNYVTVNDVANVLHIGN